MTESVFISCAGGCGTKFNPAELPEGTIMPAGWETLYITNRYRCADCTKRLREAAGIQGTDGQTVDKLDPTSRGALPKETASGILPPSVRG